MFEGRGMLFHYVSVREVSRFPVLVERGNPLQGVGSLASCDKADQVPSSGCAVFPPGQHSIPPVEVALCRCWLTEYGGASALGRHWQAVSPADTETTPPLKPRGKPQTAAECRHRRACHCPPRSRVDRLPIPSEPVPAVP